MPTGIFLPRRTVERERARERAEEPLHLFTRAWYARKWGLPAWEPER